MSVKAKYQTKMVSSREKALRAALREYAGSYVTVGVHNDAGSYEMEEGKTPVEVAKVAFWLENGTRYMPARPFFYPTLKHYEAKIARLKAQGLAAVAFHGLKAEAALAALGFAVQSWVQNTIKSNVPPALSEAYLARRKKRFPDAGSRTLLVSGLLLRSVRYKVSINGGAEVEGPATGELVAPLPAHKGQRHDTDTQGGEEARALGRELARQEAATKKSLAGFQRLAAKLNPDRQKAAFGAQRRAFKTFKAPK